MQQDASGREPLKEQIFVFSPGTWQGGAVAIEMCDYTVHAHRGRAVGAQCTLHAGHTEQ